MKNRSNNTSAPITFELLIDKPSPTEASKLFGHDQVANSLKRIIEKADTPFTIGLYGSWGSGKTTTVHLLRDKLDKLRFKYVYFDAWKYEVGSLRSAFLLEITKQLLGDKDYKKLHDELYTTEQTTKEGKTEVRFRRLFKILLYGLTIFFASFIVAVWIFNDWNKWADMLKLALSSSLIGAVLIEILFKDLLTNIVVVPDIVISKDKLSDSVKFEKKFQEIISKIKNYKILFIFDNIDRTTHDKAVELLATIKTFLEEEKCIFLIPCDESALKRHIAATYITNNDLDIANYSEEYLRKFFNIILRIPTFDEIELDTYTHSQLKTTKIQLFNDNPHLDWIITYAFRSNPREIKQFINSLISSVLLIEERTKSRHIQDIELLNNNIAFIAKMLIIQVKFPVTYKEIESLVLSEAIDWDMLNNPEYQQYMLNITGEPKFSTFMDETKIITPEGTDLDFFLTLNQSAEENLLPNWSSFLKSSLNRDFVSASNAVNQFYKENKIEELT